MKFEDNKGVIHKLKYTTIRKHEVFWKMVWSESTPSW